MALRAAPGLHRASLRFADKAAERRFQDQYFRDNLPYIRAGHVIVVVAWAVYGTYAFSAAAVGYELEVVLTYGVAIPLVAANLALTFTRWYARVWQPVMVALVAANSALIGIHQLMTGHRPGWLCVIGLMLILAVSFTLLRLQYLYAVSAAALVIGYYTATRMVSPHSRGIAITGAEVSLVVFAVIGTAAAYALERFARLLFARERQLDRERERVERERERGDLLLRNILPEAIIGRLKTPDPRTGTGHIAQRYPDVTVLFADLVGFTEQAARTDPEELVTALDDLFSRFDQLAGRFGLEKIKTIGDAYMALAGRACVPALRWPGGAPVRVRIGLATGPVVAGVIGRRKFAYDVWGDTVNTASRLESSAVPGSIQVSEAVYERLCGRYLFSEPYVVQLKGKGPTRARVLQERLPAEPATVATAGVQTARLTAEGRIRP